MKSYIHKRISLFLIFSGMVFSLLAGNQKARLIVRMDDMGAFHSVNVAFQEAYKEGIMTSVEVMSVTPWFPEAVKMLKEMPLVDVGLHLAITSEWENMKWRPLTSCPSLTDTNGYFYPMMGAHPAYPGQAIQENTWNIQEIEQEFRAQIELTLQSIPQISHLSGHMGATGFAPEVVEVVKKLSREYNLPSIGRIEAMKEYNFEYVGYDGPKQTSAEKEEAFIRMLSNLQPGKNYMFLDHPALDDAEIHAIGHIGYEDVAEDRQGVTDFLTSQRVKEAIREYNIELINFNDLTKSLPRSTPTAEKVMPRQITKYLDAVKKKRTGFT